MYSDEAGPEGQTHATSTISLAPPSAAQAHLAKEGAKRRRKHLRYIHRMTHEQQMVLIEEARAARLREQNRGE